MFGVMDLVRIPPCYANLGRMERLRISVATIIDETQLWLNTPAPSLGDGAFILKLALLALAILASAAFLLVLIPFLARAVSRTLRTLSGVHGELFVSEAAADDLKDESKRLEETASEAEKAILEACADSAAKAGSSLQKRYNDLVESITRQYEAVGKRCEEAFRKETDSLDEWIEEEEDNLRRLLIDEAVRIRIDSRRSPADQMFLNSVRTQLRPLLRKSPVEFRLRQDLEELTPHKDDTLFVRFMKSQRRADFWLWGHFGRADAEIRLRRVPFRDILRRRAGEDLFEALTNATEELRELPSKASTALQDAARILRFNLESAAAELEEPSDEDADGISVARNLIREGLERTAARLKKLLGEVEETEARFLCAVEKAGAVCASKIRSDVTVADTFGERAGKIGGTIANSYREFLDRAGASLSSGAAWKNALSAPIIGFWNSIIIALGLAALEVRSTQTQLEEATTEFALRGTPPLYRRLFKFDSLTDEDFLVGRDAELESFARAKERVSEGLSGAVAVTGPVGSGKTSLLHCAVRRYFENDALWRGRLEKPLPSIEALTKFLGQTLGIEADNMGELATGIRARKTPPVIIIEGGNLMFERRVGGFEAMRAFLGLLSMTEGKAVWIISFSKSGWRYLDRVLGLSNRFDEIITLEGLDRDGLERALVERHEVSGYELVFTDGPGLRADARWRLRGIKDPRRQQEILRAEFFDELHAASGSNLHAALYYWLRYTNVADRRRVVASPVQAISTAALGELSDDELFTMLYVLQHDSLTADQHARLLRTNVVESGLTLDYLTRRRVLLKRRVGAHSVYFPNPILAEPSGKILKNRNLVYA